MSRDHFGTVFLIGAGPGDPDLLTVKAQRLISQSDALVYDSLIPLELLELVPEQCQLHSVGKRRGHHSVPQEEINDILYSLSQKCSRIVRLKGGDPFLFGRGAEEASFLAKKGVSVEVVPGVTSGIAVPAYIGIPLTHRLAGSSVTFVTGNESINKQRPTVNWRSLALSTNTLVIYMGLYNLDFISAVASSIFTGFFRPVASSIPSYSFVILLGLTFCTSLSFVETVLTNSGDLTTASSSLVLSFGSINPSAIILLYFALIADISIPGPI